ncbi:putative GNAT family acetyltransferase [Parabacteroides sp. PF5-5]|uniref:GNAT family N-acetyltransferase n=1 Tax=unclassified Parabacteroides TaxID=2649774 RepID=UPI00247373CD|nr:MULTISPECIES: GNAT family N-acetyltransferase [unclassified Parabacteroides]MDH6306910.1 putative GNAT family acetyltransferase [Parabacteroides sp. PH5-39]MDH6317702.1 putative GNAT family acetyltransferase [Parabacteroides sp. PF5-13]MDH6321711.1 putative GNAT family acetyltransferase [Parabacteroides sp. PH5-13]MDH6325297.1 putative GNAT family acetyltransferase [Parabacteroides sp. PH5-8]MDH6328887.1 putative GNAT family acetyltransferase [Parabacteroides sp. PH5-41]
MEIKHEEHIDRGIFRAFIGGKEAGMIIYINDDDDTVIIYHTEINHEYGGRGVGKALIGAIADFAREKGVYVVPLCHFANYVFRKTPAYKDLLVPNEWESKFKG